MNTSRKSTITISHEAIEGLTTLKQLKITTGKAVHSNKHPKKTQAEVHYVNVHWKSTPREAMRQKQTDKIHNQFGYTSRYL